MRKFNISHAGQIICPRKVVRKALIKISLLLIMILMPAMASFNSLLAFQQDPPAVSKVSENDTRSVAPDLEIFCAENSNLSSCLSQDEINSDFETWLEGFYYTGGCIVTEEGLDVLAPDKCGGITTVVYVVYDDCDQYETCTATFTVDPAPDLTISCPTDVVIPSCSTQQEVDDAFAVWLAGFTYEGGCNVTESGFDGVLAPSYCGGEVTREYSVYDDCEQTANCSSTFMVEPPPAVEFWCAEPMSIPGCNTQEYVDTAFEQWLTGFGYTGGCTVTEIGLEGLVAPDKCGGTVTVEYSVIDDCYQENRSTTCTSTFTVDPAPELIISCPTDVLIPSCSTQQEVDDAFAVWLAGFTYEGGCNVTESGFDGVLAPSFCGGEVTRVYSVYDDCYQSVECSSTFTVEPAPLLEVFCPEDVHLDNPTVGEVFIAFMDWIDGFGYTGGCNVTDCELKDLPERSIEVTITIEYTISDACGQSASCSSTFSYTCGGETISEDDAPIGLGNQTQFNDLLTVDMQAYPNPSIQDVVTITFKVPVTTRARLEVYNISGEMIEVLYDAVAQENTIIQSMLNANELPPGIYYYRLNVKSNKVEPVTISKLIITR